LTEFVCALKVCHYDIEKAAEKCDIHKHTARKWYLSPAVQAVIKAEQEYILAKYDISIESVEQELATIAYEDNDKLLERKALHNKVKALELLGVQRGMFVRGVDVDVQINLGDRLRDALERRKQRLALKQQQVIPVTATTIQDVVLPPVDNTPKTTPRVVTTDTDKA
jgi:predicted site-specific integrase-resolvase